MLTVLTRDGKSPEKGGVRIGYSALCANGDTIIYLLGGAPQGYRIAAKQYAPPTEKVFSGQMLEAVRNPGGRSVDCPHCDERKFAEFMQSAVPTGVATCYHCHGQFRVKA